MTSLSSNNIQKICGGFGYYPGYDREAHIRAGNLLVGGTAGFITGLVRGFWEKAVEYTK